MAWTKLSRMNEMRGVVHILGRTQNAKFKWETRCGGNHNPTRQGHSSQVLQATQLCVGTSFNVLKYGKSECVIKPGGQN